VPEALDDKAVEQLLFLARPTLIERHLTVPNWAYLHRELKRQSITLFLLWQEDKATEPEGFQYSWFCQGYRHWAGKLNLVMRQNHRAGEDLFVDYAGQTMPVVHPRSGEVYDTEIFIAVLGALNYTYAEAKVSPAT
jgi:transposase